MKNQTIYFFSRIALSFFIFVLLHGFYTGIITQVRELDSLMYHIPIAKWYLTGKIFSYPASSILHRYFPGASEGILAVFMLLHIPLNLYNVLAIFCLSLVAYDLGKKAGLTCDMAILLSVGISLSTGITRWINVQIIDIWLAVFYTYALSLVLKPNKEFSYFVKLGIALGMLIGTKYSGPLYGTVLVLFFGKKILPKITVQRLIGFILPVSIFGIFWYIRNFVITGNPFYPLAILSFPGIKNWALEIPTWKAFITYPASMMSALINEYLSWSFLLFLLPIYMILRSKKKEKKDTNMIVFTFLSIANFLVFCLLPNGDRFQVHVSNLRYSYPVFIPLILNFFLLAKEKKIEIFAAILVLANAMFSIQVTYHPKLILVYIILLLFIWRKTILFTNT